MPKQFGHFELITKLAEGGMAEIYLARQHSPEGLNRLVVIKKVHSHLSQNDLLIDMFLDEARVAAQMNHPNIVQILDFGKEDEDYFIVMEYLEGENLHHLLREAKQREINLPPGPACDLIAQVCDGLNYAHHLCDGYGKPLNIIHRDVSPSNIVVLFSGMVKLVDFGIAKAASNVHFTQVGVHKGKPGYMSPEHCRAEPLDQRSDLFSLGVVFWELLTRQRLFHESNDLETFQAVLQKPIPRVRVIRPEIKEELDEIIYHALQRNRQDRFQSAAEMGSAIRQWLRNSDEASDLTDVAAIMNQVFMDRAPTKVIRLEAAFQPIQDEESKPGAEHENGLIRYPVEVLAKARFHGQQNESVTKPLTKTIPNVLRIFRNHRSLLLVGLGLVFLLALFIVFWLQEEMERNSQVKDVDSILGKILAMTNDSTGTESDTKVDSQISTHEVPSDLEFDIALTQADSGIARLQVYSQPSGCRASLNGSLLGGLTPLLDVQVDPDKNYLVEVECNNEKKSRRVKAEKGDQVVLNFSFGPTKKRKPSGDGSQKATGILRLNTDPWSEVYWSGKKLGVTPLPQEELPAGLQKLILINRQLGIKKTVKVEIRPGKATTLRIRLKP